MQNRKYNDIHASRDVIMGNQVNYIADLSHLEAQLGRIIDLLREREVNIQISGNLNDSLLLVGQNNSIEINRSIFGEFGKLQSSANSLQREEIYLTRFILVESYARLQRLYIPLSGFLYSRPTMRLTDSSDPKFSQAGIKVDDLRDAITKHNKTRLVILGEPGSGKTTTLQRLALDLALERLRNPHNSMLPLRADLYKYNGEQPDIFLEGQWNLTGLSGNYADARNGRQICFLLDGVNQMPGKERSKFVGQWTHWANQDLPPELGHWVIFTCRTADYIPHLGIPEVHVNVLDDQQIKHYFEARFGKNDAMRHWAEFEKRLRGGNDRFGKLARNPFMLNLMTESIAEGKSFGDSRVVLMHDLAERLLQRELRPESGQDETLIADPKSTSAIMMEALSRLAFTMQARGEGTGLTLSLAKEILLSDRKTPYLQLKELLDLAVDATLLEETILIDSKGQEELGYSFYHHLLQEYFAGQRLITLFRTGKRLSKFWRVQWRFWQFIFEPLIKGQQMPPPPTTGWEETLIFAAALAGRDANRFVAEIAKHNLPLAGRCLAEIGNSRNDVEPQSRKLKVDLLVRQRDPYAHIRARIDAGLALGELGHPELVPQEFIFEGRKVWAISPPMQKIPAGFFLLGSDPSDKNSYDDEKISERLITLSEYAIGRYPVTNSEYRFFIEGDGYKDDRWWSIEGLHWKEGGSRAHESAINDWLEFRELISRIGVEKMASRLSWTSSNRRFWEDVIALSDEAARAQAESTFERPFDRPGQWDDPALSSPARPVVSVNWYEASAYCKWLSAVTGKNYRLPTEIEWEKAARGVNGRKYPWGDNFDFRKCNSVESQIFKTTPIGLYPKGVSPFGLWDVSGNVAEWTSSWYQAYPSNLFEQNEFGEKYRVVRGGSWNYNQNSVRCAYRSRNDPVDFSYRGFGFRLLSPKE